MMTWDGSDRRRQRPHGSEPVTNDDLDEALAIHSLAERDYIENVIAGVLKAFPDGVENHCAYHQSKIEAAKAEKEFWVTARQEIIKRGVSGLFHLFWILAVLALLGASVKFGFALPAFLVGKP